MRVKLTADTVAAAATTGRDYNLQDKDLPGFHLRVTKAGVKSFRYRYKRPGGAARCVTIGKAGAVWTPQKARAVANDYAAQVRTGGDPARQRDEDRAAATVAELWSYYSESVLSKKGESTQRHYRQMWRSHLEPNLGSLHVHELSAKRLEKFQADVTAGKSKRGTKTKRKHGGPVAANHSLNLLSGMCELAIRYDIISANPVSGVERNRNTPRDYLFSAAELRLIAASVAQETDQGVRVAFRLFMETPLRHANVAKAEWSEFVGLGTDDAVWTIPAHKMKAGKPYAIGISRDLGDLIVAYREECTVLSTRWLFPMGRGISGAQKTPMVDFSTPRDSFKSAWRRIRARALKMAGESAADYRALNSAGVHAFRHAFVSRAAEMDGVTAFDIQQLGSWADIKTGMGYIHAGAQRKNALASKVAGDVRALIREGEAMKLTEKVVSLIGPRTSAG